MFPSKKVCRVERGKQLVVDVVVPARRKLIGLAECVACDRSIYGG